MVSVNLYKIAYSTTPKTECFMFPGFNFFRPWLFNFLKDRNAWERNRVPEKFAAQKESEKFAAQKDSAIRVPLKERVCFFSQRNEVQDSREERVCFFFL